MINPTTNNTPILDSREKIKALDKSNVLGTVEVLANQIEQVWQEIKQLKIDPKYKNFKNIVSVCMGGSGLGIDIIKNCYKDSLSVPLDIVNDYNLPNYVNSDTLVILSSYSGATEEVLSCALEAKQKGAKIIVIAAGGKLLELAQTENYLSYKINPIHNPCNQPRMAIGYSVFCQLGIFHQLGLINLTDSLVGNIVSHLKATNPKLAPERVENNPAKYLSYSALDKMIVIVSAQHLIGAAHTFNNQLNENAKNFSINLVVPEMNHHFLESMTFPTHLKDNLLFFVINSSFYHPRIQKRMILAKELIEKSGCIAELIMVTAPTKLEQIWELIQLGSYTNFYLSMLNGIDPAPIPSVDWFKKQMN